FGLAFVRGATTFTLIELCNELGLSMFDGGRIGFEEFRARSLFRPASPAGSRAGADVRIAFRHAAYQELLAAEFLRTREGRDEAVQASARPRLTEQVREFVRRGSSADAGSDNCVLAAGVYLVGPSHHLLLRRIEQPVLFDRFPVTVGRYR